MSLMIDAYSPYKKKYLILFVFASAVITGCASFEATLATNIDIDSNTYELALGYNKEDAFNLLAFGSIGFLFKNTDVFVTTFGMVYEHYFTDTIGISGTFGYRFYQYNESVPYYVNNEYSGYYDVKRSADAFLMQAGIPFSWSYGKITPHIGILLYDEPKFNIGISFALRNQAVAIAFIALGATQEVWKETGKIYDDDGNEIGTIKERDKEKEKENRENAAEAIQGIMGLPVEDKLPYPAWKYR